MDYYLSKTNVIMRLVDEWEVHGQLIIAYDYDGTVFDYGNKGHTFNKVIDLLKRCRKIGAKFIVFTCNGEDRYNEMKVYLDEHDIPYDKINENCDETPFDGRKIYYNILLDDRAGLISAYNCLLQAVEIMEKQN